MTIAFRQVRLQFGYVALNVLGLSVGLASAVLSLLYIQDELAYDHYEKGDRIYKLLRRQQLGGQDPVLRDGTSGLLGSTLKSEFAEVEEFIRVLNSGGWFDHEGKSLPYLYHNVDFAQPGFARIEVVYLFAAIAGFVLLLACINFTNLATARASRRAREIGLRKAVGATRGRLMGQFLSESVFMALVALAIGLLLAYLVLPSYNDLAGKQLSLSSLLTPSSALFLLTLTLFTGLLAGSYPAVFVSAFNPCGAMKGGAVVSGGKKNLMRVLVVSQFMIATALISTTVVVRDQIEYVSNKRLGFDSEHVYVLPIYALSKRIDKPRIRDYNAWKRLFLEHPNILVGSASQTLIGWGGMLHAGYPEGFEPGGMRMWIMGVDEDFLDVHDIPLVAGRFISEADTTDAFVLNETAVKSLGWDDPVGKGFGWHKNRNGVVVGVVKDFHSRSLHEPISPVVLTKWTSSNNNLSLKISGESIPETLDFMKEVWLKIHPDKPFDGWFLDDTIDKLYASEVALARTARMSAGLAVFVACLGLFGLSSFAAQQRLREIAIRKVLGASSTFLVYLVSREFLLLVLVANIVAWPVVHVLMTEWLDNFAYHADLAAGPFATSCFLSVVIAVATVSYHAIRGAWLNPAETLRDE